MPRYHASRIFSASASWSGFSEPDASAPASCDRLSAVLNEPFCNACRKRWPSTRLNPFLPVTASESVMNVSSGAVPGSSAGPATPAAREARRRQRQCALQPLTPCDACYGCVARATRVGSVVVVHVSFSRTPDSGKPRLIFLKHWRGPEMYAHKSDRTIFYSPLNVPQSETIDISLHFVSLTRQICGTHQCRMPTTHCAVQCARRSVG